LQGQAPHNNKVSHEDTLLLKKPSAFSSQPSALSPKLKALSQSRPQPLQSLPLHPVKHHGRWTPGPSANPELHPIQHPHQS
jgi:hypothetical protein